MTPPPNLRIGARVLTRQGASHGANDDRYALLDNRNALVREAHRGVLYAVADGVGSTGKGYQAAELTCECLAEFFTTARPASEELLLDLVENADAQVRLTTESACTLAGVWLHGANALLFSLGDSVVMRYHAGELVRLTRPQVRGRGLAAFIGMGSGVRHATTLDRFTVDDGDLLMLMSDGVLEVVPERELREVLRIRPSSEALMEHVHAQLLRLGNNDDATLVVASIGAPDIHGLSSRRYG